MAGSHVTHGASVRRTVSTSDGDGGSRWTSWNYGISLSARTNKTGVSDSQ
jgi:hypothetical protein